MKTINSLRSKLLALTLALMASVSSFAYEFEYVNDFHIDGFGYKIISVNTPDDGEGYVSLIEIADCKKDVVIPKYVSYGDRGFHVTTFGMGSVVFTNEASSVVESITIPKTTSVINKNALAGCPNLKTVVVDSENPYYDSRENCNAIITTSQNPYFTPNTLIAGCKTTIIPNSVAEIGDNAFYNSALESITIPTGTTKIGRSAFNNSILLSSITLSATLIEISDWAFDDCNNLKEVICYAPQPPTISKYTFSDISPTVYVPENTVTIYQNAPYWMTFDIQPIQPSYKSQWCNQWNILSHGYLGPQDPLAGARTSIYWLSNNTVNRNGQEYIPLMCSSSLPNEESTLLVGELRFTEDKQVYFYYAFDETEYLLYDFGAELGDTLELFAGLEFYNYHKTYTHVITDKETLDDGRLQIQADVVIRIDNGAGEYFEEKHPVTWIEGLGSTYGIIFNPSNPGVAGDGAIIMLCAYRDDECVYTTNFSDYKNMGCVYNNDGTVDEDLFPMLAGLQRTVCNEFCGDTEDDNSSNTTYKQTFDKILFERDQPYIYCNSAFLLREENNKILIYSHSLDKDLVLYDFTLEVGDSLPQLYLDEEAKKDIYWIYYEYMNVVDYNKYNDSIYPADTLIVTDVSMITLLDGKEYKKWTFNNGMEYVEGIGMYGGRRGGNFFGLIQEVVVPCHTGTHLVCVSKNNQLLYQMDDAEMERLGAECLCEAETPEDLFPTLWGLQRTGCTKTIGEDEEGTVWGSRSYLMQEIETATIDGKQYLLFGIDNNYDKLYLKLWLREENNKILLYSTAQKKDLVLYDFTLNVGDSLPRLYVDYDLSSVVDYDNDEWGLSPLVVTEVSTITLLDGKEYKKWTFDNGMQYVEGIGSFGTCYAHNDFYQLIANAPLSSDVYSQYLVCASRNGKLLYQMDDAEMERLGAECLCDYNSGPKRDNAKDGQIGGRPTPTQWNMLEMELRKMENGISILQAETFSYTLEDISQQVNSRTYFQLARQSTKDTATTKSVVGALHFGKEEDNRVYFLRDGVEYVLYDFTAEPGDTIEIFAGINNYPQYTTYTHVVTSKDTLENGACRMMLEVVFPKETSTAENVEKVWLAGLGSVDGIVHNAAKRASDVHAAPARSASSETQTSVMLCAWREDSCLYTTDHPDYDTFGCVYNQDPTSVENPTSPSSYQKLLRDGQLLIIHNDKIYNVLGLDIGKSSIKIVESLTNN